jgi:hypothetical protein
LTFICPVVKLARLVCDKSVLYSFFHPTIHLIFYHTYHYKISFIGTLQDILIKPYILIPSEAWTAEGRPRSKALKVTRMHKENSQIQQKKRNHYIRSAIFQWPMTISRAELSFVALSDTSAIGSRQNTPRFLTQFK